MALKSTQHILFLLSLSLSSPLGHTKESGQVKYRQEEEKRVVCSFRSGSVADI